MKFFKKPIIIILCTLILGILIIKVNNPNKKIAKYNIPLNISNKKVMKTANYYDDHAISKKSVIQSEPASKSPIILSNSNIKSTEPIDLNLNNNKFHLAFNIQQKDDMQSLAYNNDSFYIGFDVGNGNGIIRQYGIDGKLINQTKKLATGHSAGLVYRKANGHFYVCNGSGDKPTFIYEVDMSAKTPRILSTLNLNSLGNSALIAVNNDTDQLIVYTAVNDKANPTFSICNFDGIIIKQFKIPNQGIPQGLSYYQNHLYLYTNNKITILDLNGKVVKSFNINENGESEGLTIGVKQNKPFIAIGYNSPNRLYILYINENNYSEKLHV